MRRLACCLALVTLSVGSLLPWHPARGQTAPQVPRIGFLSPGDDRPTALLNGFRQGLEEHGFVDGRTVRVEYRWADGHFDRLRQLAAELVALKVDVIVTAVTAASLAAHAETKTIPIVMIGVADPVEAGLVASLGRPGGNVTGTSTLQTNMAGKQVELVKAIDPALSRVAILWNPANSAFQHLQVSQARTGAEVAGLQVQLVEATGPDEFATAFAAIRREGAQVLVVMGDPTFTIHRNALLGGALQERLVTVCGTRDYAEAGCLISYGPSYFDASRRSVSYVARIIKGARPGDIPVEQPTRFDLTVNMKAAGALGMTISPMLLARADEVIE